MNKKQSFHKHSNSIQILPSLPNSRYEPENINKNKYGNQQEHDKQNILTRSNEALKKMGIQRGMNYSQIYEQLIYATKNGKVDINELKQIQMRNKQDQQERLNKNETQKKMYQKDNNLMKKIFSPEKNSISSNITNEVNDSQQNKSLKSLHLPPIDQNKSQNKELRKNQLQNSYCVKSDWKNVKQRNNISLHQNQNLFDNSMQIKQPSSLKDLDGSIIRQLNEQKEIFEKIKDQIDPKEHKLESLRFLLNYKSKNQPEVAQNASQMRRNLKSIKLVI
ncbi:hypothetical protein PPERSA_05677 [Pseudocohnilembus persalinus]|uniref:Uncharacterized protein n=1 Tax=Pseudocohnilembus persalinus TaxID=266149 RepID=A0A0V0QME2_PSEPJ|nr:hypothetical protein PPERSA_05677 [Pseudocohnilembus persalinus]|eukprot:KRX03319.1 hypothetical protein PPERSA_05677 [Pseudocohnilembus persalinus]